MQTFADQGKIFGNRFKPKVAVILDPAMTADQMVEKVMDYFDQVSFDLDNPSDKQIEEPKSEITSNR